MISEEAIRFEIPSLPEEVAKQEGFAVRATAELTDLCQTVIEMLEDAYVDWDEEGAGEDAWSEETFSTESTLEDQ